MYKSKKITLAKLLLLYNIYLTNLSMAKNLSHIRNEMTNGITIIIFHNEILWSTYHVHEIESLTKYFDEIRPLPKQISGSGINLLLTATFHISTDIMRARYVRNL